MSFWATVADTLSSGGLTSVVSGAFGAYVKLKEKKLDLNHQYRQWKYEISAYRQQAAHEKYLAENKLLIAKQAGADIILTAAIQAEASLSHEGLPWWVGATRVLLRPYITIFLWVSLVGLVLYLGDELAPAPAHVQDLIETLRHGAASTLGFWFGARIVGNQPNR